MAKTKDQLLDEAQKAGRAPETAGADDYSLAELEQLLSDDTPAWKGSVSSNEQLVGPDGHVHLSKEDIRARDSA